jgi:hypothetical protein
MARITVEAPATMSPPANDLDGSREEADLDALFFGVADHRV